MPPSRPPKPNPDAGTSVERAVALGIDLLRQARAAGRGRSVPATRERQMAAEHRAALVRYEASVRQHQGRVAGARVGTVAGAAGSAVLGLSTLASVSSGSPVEVVLLGGLTAGSAALGWVSMRRRRELVEHPPVPMLPPLPPARVRPGARGADQADRVASALLHLYDLVPNVGGLYPQAGQELWRAVSDVEPLLRGQAERLASLDRIEWEMPGSRAAEAAVEAGGIVTARLRVGADALEELIAAAARMLAAPDVGDGVPDVLAPAIDSLDAFAFGLHAADAARLGGPS